MRDFFSVRRVERGQTARPCRMCGGDIPRGVAHLAVSQRSLGTLTGYRLHVACGEAAGIAPRNDVIFPAERQEVTNE